MELCHVKMKNHGKMEGWDSIMQHQDAILEHHVVTMEHYDVKMQYYDGTSSIMMSRWNIF